MCFWQLLFPIDRMALEFPKTRFSLRSIDTILSPICKWNISNITLWTKIHRHYFFQMGEYRTWGDTMGILCKSVRFQQELSSSLALCSWKQAHQSGVEDTAQQHQLIFCSKIKIIQDQSVGTAHLIQWNKDYLELISMAWHKASGSLLESVGRDVVIGLIFNFNNHIVCCFKDKLIFLSSSSFFWRRGSGKRYSTAYLPLLWFSKINEHLTSSFAKIFWSWFSGSTGIRFEIDLILVSISSSSPWCHTSKIPSVAKQTITVWEEIYLTFVKHCSISLAAGGTTAIISSSLCGNTIWTSLSRNVYLHLHT